MPIRSVLMKSGRDQTFNGIKYAVMTEQNNESSRILLCKQHLSVISNHWMLLCPQIDGPWPASLAISAKEGGKPCLIIPLFRYFSNHLSKCLELPKKHCESLSLSKIINHKAVHSLVFISRNDLNKQARFWNKASFFRPNEILLGEEQVCILGSGEMGIGISCLSYCWAVGPRNSCISEIRLQSQSMQSQKRNIRAENHYSRISLKKRQRLVNMVVKDGLLISKSGKRLGIKLSTAKLIVKRYRETGTFFESKEQKTRRLMEEDKKKKIEAVKVEVPSFLAQQIPQEIAVQPFTEQVVTFWWPQLQYPELPLYSYPFYSNWM